MRRLRLEDFDYPVHPAQIAQAPCEPRDACRLLVIEGEAEAQHRRFGDICDYLVAGDVLVVNRTMVLPARLRLARGPHRPGELLLLRPVDGDVTTACEWEAMGRPARLLQAGGTVYTQAGTALWAGGFAGGRGRIRGTEPLWQLMQAEGQVPLPPYIRRGQTQAADARDYQTVFAREPGAVAAPTASLHFTAALLQRLRDRGVQVAEVVLHVGGDTFLPISERYADDVRRHPMHGELYEVPAATLAACQAARQAGRQVVAVGTTSLRALESCARSGELRGETRLFIYPGIALQLCSGLITNFHQPRSTLLLLVAALVGRERLISAYAEAASLGYRFFSYGDAMLIKAAPG